MIKDILEYLLEHGMVVKLNGVYDVLLYGFMSRKYWVYNTPFVKEDVLSITINTIENEVEIILKDKLK